MSTFFTPEQAAGRLGTSANEVLRMVRSGKLRGREVGGQMQIERSAVLQLQSKSRARRMPEDSDNHYGNDVSGF